MGDSDSLGATVYTFDSYTMSMSDSDNLGKAMWASNSLTMTIDDFASLRTTSRYGGVILESAM